ncbi:hypothetical protein QTJ16_002444 [Diplocarpon rosae]|uniref:Uncharacterized protein n=1 Tax=Diplocarpon rosae TaxID=946125 RepID=A0AAD9WF08_9HELO|nr:hypothetical protein QTJ16_002444 [Diplocarpon rosae]
MYLRTFVAVSSLALTVSSVQAPLLFDSEVLDHGPHLDHARRNAPHIFKALHSSMRQWGSSLNHNGMSFFSAAIPNNTLLYHGTRTKDRVNGTEWLAFEIEHAEVFARSRGPRGGKPGERPPGGPGGGPPDRGPPSNGRPQNRPEYPSEPGHGLADGPPKMPTDDDDGVTHGYLHIYRTSRALNNLLYLDGMSAGKTSLGTLDTQDLILRNDSKEDDHHPWSDYERAQTMCALGQDYGIEGILRMEAGFELILCNFSSGVDFLSAAQRPDYDKPEAYADLSHFEYVRGVAARYHGITAGRVAVNYSSMVSAFFYPLNLTNPDPSRAELPRLPASEREGLARIKSDVLGLFSQPRSVESVDWQGVVDMVVTRYADRLQLLASNLTERALLSEINFLLNVFVDYAEPSLSIATERCATSYLTLLTLRTESDFLIYEAIVTVTRKICSTLFELREILLNEDKELTKLKESPNAAIQELIEYLSWSTWLECGKCGYDEVCYVAIWPWGGVEDHFSPGCRKSDEMSDRRGYWDVGR